MIYTPTKRLLRVFSLVVTILFVSAPALFAEETAKGDNNALEKWVLDGGWPMILIGLAIIALLALSVFIFGYFTPMLCGMLLIDAIFRAVRQKSFEAAITFVLATVVALLVMAILGIIGADRPTGKFGFEKFSTNTLSR